MKKLFSIPVLLLIVQHAVAQWAYTGSKIYYDAGNVGIGYSDPIDKLHVHGNTFIYGNIRLGQQLEGVGPGNQLVFNDHGNSDPIWMARYNVANNATELRMNIGDEGEQADKFAIGYTYWDGGTWVPKFTFQADGKMGIGTNSPQTTLDVNGTIRASGTNAIALSSQSNLGISIQQANINNDFVNANNYLSIYAHNLHHTGTGWVRRNQYSSGWATVLNNGYYDIAFAPDNQAGAANETVTPSSVFRITLDGNVGIGTTTPGVYKLAVNGKVVAKEIKVKDGTPWPDYVFNKDYNLMSLASLEDFIQKNNHLPNIPSAQEVKENDGIELGAMNAKLLEKIEELTLYMIELKKENEATKEEVKKLSVRLEAISHK